MKSYDFEAVIVEDGVFCLECVPPNVEAEDGFPIFADSEWENYPVCCVCNFVHEYVTLLGS